MAKKSLDYDSLDKDQKDIADKVFLFSKLLSEEENATLMSACDVYVAPSHNESFGRPIVEAQAAGKPVLTVAATATQEVVRHGVTGFAAKVKEELFQKERILLARAAEELLQSDQHFILLADHAAIIIAHFSDDMGQLGENRLTRLIKIDGVIGS